jgi:sterol-4alpha-carboxylate 3-dehydrogenase (decarboxylating)
MERWDFSLVSSAYLCNCFYFHAYHITNDGSIFFWVFLSRLLVGLGYDAPKRHLPFMLIYMIALVLNFFVFILKPIKEIRPTFTPMTVCLAGTHHFYSSEAAKRDMGYEPIVSLDEGIDETVRSFSHLSKKST